MKSKISTRIVFSFQADGNRWGPLNCYADGELNVTQAIEHVRSLPIPDWAAPNSVAVVSELMIGTIGIDPKTGWRLGK